MTLDTTTTQLSHKIHSTTSLYKLYFDFVNLLKLKLSLRTAPKAQMKSLRKSTRIYIKKKLAVCIAGCVVSGDAGDPDIMSNNIEIQLPLQKMINICNKNTYTNQQYCKNVCIIICHVRANNYPGLGCRIGLLHSSPT